MLHVFYGDLPTAIYNTAVYFKNVYEDAWLTTPPVPQIIEDIDKSTVISGGVIDSPVLGKISPLGLSGGVKTLILIQNVPEKTFNASTCGDNCAPWLLRLAEKKDVTVNLRHLIRPDRPQHEGTRPDCRTLCLKEAHDERFAARHHPEQTHPL